MARFKGNVGYGIATEAVEGVWSDVITERAYYGTVIKDQATQVQSDKVNNDIRLEERISIVADAFALGNYTNIKYVELAGSLWTVTAVEVKRPRLILSIGGVYNGPGPTPSVPPGP